MTENRRLVCTIFTVLLTELNTSSPQRARFIAPSGQAWHTAGPPPHSCAGQLHELMEENSRKLRPEIVENSTSDILKNENLSLNSLKTVTCVQQTKQVKKQLDIRVGYWSDVHDSVVTVYLQSAFLGLLLTYSNTCP